MNDPLVSLVVTFGLLAALAAVFWPVRGWWWRWQRAGSADRRVQVEDALKHLYDCEYRGTVATLHSLAGTLGVSADRTADLLRRLQAMELVTTRQGGHRLTAEGRSYALRVVRTHRLWERFLSDETSVRPADWHHEAELREHRTSEAEAEALSARLGHPRYDPHGDPIPTRDGEMPPPAGVRLTELEADTVAHIVHVEDEPEAVYAQLAASGLHPGVALRVLAVEPNRIRLEVHGEEEVLAPVVAANLFVRRTKADLLPAPGTPLSSLATGSRAVVAGIAPTLRGTERRRLLDLGIVPGTAIAADRRAPGGDPTAYRVRGTLVALRRDQADHVWIETAAAGARDAGSAELRTAGARGDAA